MIGDNARPCTRCASNGIECLDELFRFKIQPPPPVRSSLRISSQTADFATSLSRAKEYTFSAGQTWCSPEGELSFVGEGQHLPTIYHLESNEHADYKGPDSGDATAPSDRDDNHTQSPSERLDSNSIDSGYSHSHSHIALEAHWSEDESSNRVSERQHIRSVQDSEMHFPNSPSSITHPTDYCLLEAGSIEPEKRTDDALEAALTGASVYRNVSAWPFKDPAEAKLMRYFIEKVARRFDLCDPDRHFALVVPWRAAFCPPLLDASLALSARCLSRTTDFDPLISNRYYQRCLKALIPTFEIADALKNQDLFAAVVLLRTLEEIDGGRL